MSKIKNLLNEGTNINCHALDKGARNNWGNTPLHISVNNGNFEIVEELINLGAYLTTRSYKNSTQNNCEINNSLMDLDVRKIRRKGQEKLRRLGVQRVLDGESHPRQYQRV
ncbi:ankyrin repeat domain-containing protein [Leptospira interrogans]|uniref:ankyrin repeat domain-containing protein n=1 Tax=Leptospira interrogans TaxID=173 RepID=UPI000774354E|nr:ankyrin repeat domain-containing protein [Leptospira interrogans]